MLRLPEQPPALRRLLKSLDVARKLASLYGADHSAAAPAIEDMLRCAEEFLAAFDRATCVFATGSVIVNNSQFCATPESQELSRRLRMRGVMAVTFVALPSNEQFACFLALLNEEPREVRLCGGPGKYLRSRGVTRIVVTEADHTAGSEDDDEDGVDLDGDGGLDRAVVAAINWLSKQSEDETEEPPRHAIAQILSSPDLIAGVVREAVTKMHASRKAESPSSDLAAEAISGLRDLAGSDPEEWDKSTSQVRKAIMKLPPQMRPSASGLAQPQDSDTGAAVANIDEVETRVAAVLSQDCGADAPLPPDPGQFDSLFGARAEGMLSDWTDELQPVSVARSSCDTLQTLLAWENEAAEHGRIAQSMAALVTRTVEISDFECALAAIDGLVKEAQRADGGDWRPANVRSAINAIARDNLRIVVQWALDTRDRRGVRIAADLLEAMPALAPDLLDLIGKNGAEAFDQSLKEAACRCGQSQVPLLGRLLRTGPVRSADAALEILARIGTHSALNEIADAMRGRDDVFLVKALLSLGGVRAAASTQVCLRYLDHRSPGVRCAAINALMQLGNESAVGHLVRTAKRWSIRGGDCEVKIAAVRALGRIGGDEALACLRMMAKRRPLIRRNRYEPVRRAAEQAQADALTPSSEVIATAA